jgi:hypothetical protein
LRQQCFAQVGADEAGAARDQNSLPGTCHEPFPYGRRLYLRMHQIAQNPSRQPIFFPSA